MGKQVLISFSCDYIVNFCIRNPVSFKGIKLTPGGTIGGDIRPPILGVEAFLELLKRKLDLFTQREYADFYLGILDSRFNAEWRNVLLSTQHKYNKGKRMSDSQYIAQRLYAFRSRANCNFYVSMIDTLHAWSLIQEAKWYNACYIDSNVDALAKTDLTFLRDGKDDIRVALFGPGGGRKHYEYKVTNRSNGVDMSGIHEFGMVWEREKIANKRWYELDDFLPIKPCNDLDPEHISPNDYEDPAPDYEQMLLWENEAHHAPYLD